MTWSEGGLTTHFDMHVDKVKLKEFVKLFKHFWNEV